MPPESIVANFCSSLETHRSTAAIVRLEPKLNSTKNGKPLRSAVLLEPRLGGGVGAALGVGCNSRFVLEIRRWLDFLPNSGVGDGSQGGDVDEGDLAVAAVDHALFAEFTDDFGDGFAH